ncbi:hypothetical protein [Streptacidiphilus albus]|uniref:hypothetical protein n=1 Tax=Streptacidiphilus albus TaxID=105425 RepID=UPI0005A94BB5|nr:hypothetical protein [Streptacidiphilus albus]
MSDAHEAILGPPWAVDFTLLAREAREGLPPHVQAMYDDVLFEIITARNPYVNDVALPMRSSRPLGPHYAEFDGARGWFEFTFVRRAVDPQIVVYELFWQ